jgi:hypothetical protein
MIAECKVEPKNIQETEAALRFLQSDCSAALFPSASAAPVPNLVLSDADSQMLQAPDFKLHRLPSSFSASRR